MNKSTETRVSSQAAAVIGQGDPPLLTGGVLQGGNYLITTGCDWLTLSIASGFADPLLEKSRPAPEMGSAYHKGYGMHEHRTIAGGSCRRHTGPQVASKRWGKHYESWVWSGDSALSGADMARGVRFDHSRATRIDCAFDYNCAKGTTPEEIRAGWARVWRDKMRLSPGIAGQGDPEGYTAYIGSAKGERRIRVYRKDIESPATYPGGTVMRVEVVLKGHAARAAFFQMHENGQEACVRHCAAEVFGMTGFYPIKEFGEIPIRAPKPKTKFSSAVAAMVDQWADILFVSQEAGIDLQPLINDRIGRSSRMARTRRKARLEEIRVCGKAKIMQDALEILRA